MNKEDILRRFKTLSDEPAIAFDELTDFLKSVDWEVTDESFDNFAYDLYLGFALKYDFPFSPKMDGERFPVCIYRNILNHERQKEKQEIENILSGYEDRTSDQKFGYAVLNKSEKEAAINRLNDIKDIVVSSKIDDRKKTVLIKKISNLEVEILSDRTPTERFFGFLIDLSFVSGEMAKNAKPAIDEFKDVLRILMRSRAKNEGVSLPKSDQWPQIPGPDEFAEQ